MVRSHQCYLHVHCCVLVGNKLGGDGGAVLWQGVAASTTLTSVLHDETGVDNDDYSSNCNVIRDMFLESLCAAACLQRFHRKMPQPLLAGRKSIATGMLAYSVMVTFRI